MKRVRKVPGITLREKITYHLSSGIKVREYGQNTYVTRENWREIRRARHDYATHVAHTEMGEWFHTREERAAQGNREFETDDERDSIPFMPVFSDVGRKTAWRIPLHSIAAISVRSVFRIQMRPSKRSMEAHKDKWMERGLQNILENESRGDD